MSRESKTLLFRAAIKQARHEANAMVPRLSIKKRKHWAMVRAKEIYGECNSANIK